MKSLKKREIPIIGKITWEGLRKIVTKILPDTVKHNVSPAQAKKNYSFTLDKDGTFLLALGPGTTCWPGGGLKCSAGVGGSKMASRGEEWLLTPPTPTYGPSNLY